MQARRDDLDLALATLVDEGMDLVLQAAAHEDGALVALAHRPRIRNAGCIHLDIEALLRLQLAGRRRPLVGGGWNRRRGGGRELHGAFGRRWTDGPRWRRGGGGGGTGRRGAVGRGGGE